MPQNELMNERMNLYPWLAIRVKANREEVVASALRNRGFEEFLPSYRCRRKWSDRIKDVQLPLFPGYLFSRFDVNNRLGVLTIPGVVHIVGIQKVPLPVDDAEIQALQTVVASGVSVQPWPFLRAGGQLVLGAGPLRGLEGILVSEKNEIRLIVSVKVLQRSIAVEVDRDWVVPKEKPAASRGSLALAAPAA